MTPDLAILVAGSRHWPQTHRHVIDDALTAELLSDFHENPADPLLIHGGCPTGADALADAFWRTLGDVREPEVWPANWALGRKAGPLRNMQMVGRAVELRDYGARVVVLGFPWGWSHGTRGCLRLAIDAGLSTVIVAEGSDVMGCPPPGERSIT